VDIALTPMDSIFNQVSWHASFIILSPAIHWIGWVELVGQANFCGMMQKSGKKLGHRDIFVLVCVFVCTTAVLVVHLSPKVL
jgi:hypothetical protein